MLSAILPISSSYRRNECAPTSPKPSNEVTGAFIPKDDAGFIADRSIKTDGKRVVGILEVGKGIRVRYVEVT